MILTSLTYLIKGKSARICVARKNIALRAGFAAAGRRFADKVTNLPIGANARRR